MTSIEIPKKLVEGSKWEKKNRFLMKIKAIENLIKYNNRTTRTDSEYVCTLCKKKKVVIEYNSEKYRWNSILYHIISEHNFKPNTDFIEFILKYNISAPTEVKKITVFNSNEYTINNLRYVKLEKNQLMILDALMEHGGYTKKYHNRKKRRLQFSNSEHSGLLDFDNSGLERIIVSGKTNRIDPGDSSIFLPENMEDAIDYEYIFHTHPPTPYPGGRAKDGILFEFPSISDLFHFMDHYNDGITQGSIIIAPEGLYNIRKKNINDLTINLNEERLLNKMRQVVLKLQDKAIKKYGTEFSTKTFYSKIAQDLQFINSFNDALQEFDLHIDYLPRIEYNEQWVLDDVMLPIFVVEKKK
jgi:hypothetical protein